jgi:acyl-coenzyme A synthetase/AMP-(fatty) acid ligase
VSPAYITETVDLLARVRSAGAPSVSLFAALGSPLEAGHLSVCSAYVEYADAPEPTVHMLLSDPSHVIYTSGSSGPPKPIMFVEEN